MKRGSSSFCTTHVYTYIRIYARARCKGRARDIKVKGETIRSRDERERSSGKTMKLIGRLCLLLGLVASGVRCFCDYKPKGIRHNYKCIAIIPKP